MPSKSKYPFWLVKVRGGDEWIGNDLQNKYLTPFAVCTSDRAEAAHFGRDMASQVAAFHKDRCQARMVKVVSGGKATKAVKPVVRPVHLAMIIDGSGSMGSVVEPTKQAYNEIIETVKTEAKKNGIPTKVSQVTFGANTGRLSARTALSHWGHSPSRITGILNCEVREDFHSVPVESVPLFQYQAYGNTPLLDAVGYTIDRLKSLGVPDREQVLVQVITDGNENVSSKYTAESVVRMLKQCQDAGNWTFVFHLPPGHKANFCKTYGVPEGNCREWERSAVGLRDLTRVTGASTQQYYGQAAVGKTASRGFFEVDLADVKTKDIKKNLKDVSGKLIKLDVKKEMAIKDFVEQETGSYRAGDSFYLLNKDERLAHHKKLIVREKGTKQFYSGEDARKVLGLPPATPFSEVKLRPYNLSTFELWLQSNSTNRKLSRGQSVLVLKPGETL